ncbi:MAG: DUF4446 family protein [Clostridia bacterium]|nr:DUF4446 family protein [Clostridia bacterium]
MLTKEILILAAAIIGLLFVVVLFVLIMQSLRLRHAQRKIDELSGTVSQLRGQSKFNGSMTELELNSKLTDITDRLDTLETKQQNNLDKVNVVRYFATDKNEGRASYSVGITNAQKDGLVLTALMYRNGMNLYVKQVEDGVSDYPLSDEEKEAVSRSKVTKIL